MWAHQLPCGNSAGKNVTPFALFRLVHARSRANIESDVMQLCLPLAKASWIWAAVSGGTDMCVLDRSAYTMSAVMVSTLYNEVYWVDACAAYPVATVAKLAPHVRTERL